MGGCRSKPTLGRRCVPGSRTMRLAALAALTLIACVADGLPSDYRQAASAESQTVIYGADSGSHLRITTDRGGIVVNGYMTPNQPLGCAFTRFRSAAICPTAGVGSMQIVMGPADDKVE